MKGVPLYLVIRTLVLGSVKNSQNSVWVFDLHQVSSLSFKSLSLWSTQAEKRFGLFNRQCVHYSFSEELRSYAYVSNKATLKTVLYMYFAFFSAAKLQNVVIDRNLFFHFRPKPIVNWKWSTETGTETDSESEVQKSNFSCIVLFISLKLVLKIHMRKILAQKENLCCFFWSSKVFQMRQVFLKNTS